MGTKARRSHSKQRNHRRCSKMAWESWPPAKGTRDELFQPLSPSCKHRTGIFRQGIDVQQEGLRVLRLAARVDQDGKREMHPDVNRHENEGLAQHVDALTSLFLARPAKDGTGCTGDYDDTNLTHLPKLLCRHEVSPNRVLLLSDLGALK